MTFLNRRLFGNHPPLSVFSLPNNALQHLFKGKKMNGLPKQLQITLNRSIFQLFQKKKKNTAPFMLKKQKGNHPELIYNEGNGNYWIQRFPESHSSNVVWNCFVVRTVHTEKNVKCNPVEGSGVLQKATLPFKNDGIPCFIPHLQWQAQAQLLLSMLYLLETLWRGPNASVTTLSTS